MTSQFCHLHVHSEYSLLDGIIRIPDLVNAAKKFEMPAVALTDHGVMYGAIQLIQKCREKGVKPIIGCEVYVANGARTERSPDRKGTNSHLVLLALDDTGYRNLCTLVSLAYREGYYYKPRIDHELLSQYSEGLVGMSACIKGEINKCLIANDFKRAQKFAELYRDILGPDRFYLEIHDHDLPEQQKINPLLIDLARATGIPLVATNDCHFLKPGEQYIQDVMLCVQTSKKLADTDRMKGYTPHHYFKSPQEMEKRFKWVPEAITNTARIAEMVTYNPSFDRFLFPEFKPPDGSSPEDYLRRTALEGLAARMQGKVPSNHKERLDYELGVICDMGFASYCLIVADFVKWAKDHDIAVGPGRGSAAGSITSYAMGITDLDPINYGLHFERFLNPARKSMPDIDIDFDPVRRAEVIDYVARTYGADHVCQIITFNRLKARAAIRDVGRVMDIPLSEVDKIAKLVPWGSDLKTAIEKDKDFAEIYESSDLTKKWINTAKQVEGLARNASIHAAGVIISADPVWEHAPVQVMDGESGLVCQFSMGDAEKAGLVKMDFLGLRTLSYLREACANIKATRGIDIDLLKIPLNDKKTFRMLAKGDVLGVFQMEGSGMRDLLMGIAPDSFNDLIATIALFRPGPMEHDLHHKYARRKNKKEEITFRHALLKPILESTYGTLTYQEQISSILQAVGGIDMANATLIMKQISKKTGSIGDYKEQFVKGASAHGVDRKTAEDIFAEMESFLGYGFNKAHSAAYGLIAYQTAWLKANYPLEFLSAYLTSEIQNQEKIAWIIEEMKGSKIPVYPPDVNKSEAKFTVEDKGIRFGLAAIKNVGIQAVESIVEARKKGGPFSDIYQIAARSDIHLLNKSTLEGLISAGACDNLGGNRRSMLEAAADALDYGKKVREDTARGQVALFGAPGAGRSPALPQLEEFKRSELLKMEKSSLGFFLSHHPLEDVWEEIKKYARENISDLGGLKDGRIVRVGGMLGSVQRKIAKKTLKYYANFNLEDMTGKIDGVVFPQAFEQFGGLVETDAFVVMKGRLKIDELESTDEDNRPRKQLQLIAEEVWRYNPESDEKWVQSKSPELVPIESKPEEDIMLDDGLEQYEAFSGYGVDAVVHIVLDFERMDKSAFSRIGAQLASKAGPTPVRFCFPINGKKYVVYAGDSRRVVYSPQLREALKLVEGVEEVRLEHG